MLNLELSTFFGEFEELDALSQLLNNFNEQFGAVVKTKRMHWMTSWSDLISVASLGTGPDVSQIGNTWISSLTGLNAIRTFMPHETEDMGGDLLFAGNKSPSSCWSIPWTSYAFVICYRKDRLQEQGIAPETAFANQQATLNTIQTLSKIKGAWLTPFVPAPYPDLLHIAASWIWGNGGELVVCDNARPKVTFDEPKAMQGLAGWLDTYRGVSPEHRLSARDCMAMFQQGKASAIVSGIRTAHAMYKAADEETRQNIGFASISNTPWSGGDSLVIWKHTKWDPKREDLALKLVKFLTSQENVVRFCQMAHSLPARQDALEMLYPASHPMRKTVQIISQNGRRYPEINEWRSIEHQMVQELDNIVHEATKNPGRSSLEVLKKHLPPLAQRLNRTM
jgi:ABC-type glycerol-3-phosphate transport system substrate-binding protein